MRHPSKPLLARRSLMALAALVCLICSLSLAAAEPQGPKVFPSADAAWKALLSAAEKNDGTALKDIFGPGSENLLSSGDPVADGNGLARFVEAAKEKATLETYAEGRMAVVLGQDNWPLPIPIVKVASGWAFDPATGQEEMINRRIGKNEIYTIHVCRAIVEAQFEFANSHSIHHFAQHFLSSEGQHDGLYWNTKEGEPESPLGLLAAEASAEGYGEMKRGQPQPYHGYFFKILTAQGKDAPGGEKSYLDKEGKMTGGFAIVAWPAIYGASGIMTFIVNQQDIVFEKDLGEKTNETVKGMTAYNPGPNWTPARD